MAYIYDIADTWAASGTVFTGIKLSVTDTASAAGSLLMDLQVGGSSKFKVDKAGVFSVGTHFGALIMDNSVGTTLRGSSDYRLTLSAVRSSLIGFSYALSASQGQGCLAEGGLFGFSSAIGGVGDLYLARDAANTLAQRNGVNAQSFNLYNTYTDASNYERGFMRFVSNTLRIGTEKLGTGTARGIEFYTNDVLRADITADGAFVVRSGFIRNLGGGGVVSIWSLFGGASNFIGTESNHAFNLTTANTTRLTADTVGSVRIATALTVATLPATPLVGMMARVTDATSPTVGSTVAGGGAAAALCWYNGTNWTVIGA